VCARELDRVEIGGVRPTLGIRLPNDLIQVRSDFKKQSLDALSNILWTARKFEATDPRDKICVLLGLAADGDGRDIQPIYDGSVTDANMLRHIALVLLRFVRPEFSHRVLSFAGI
jgi:hypothetical protein